MIRVLLNQLGQAKRPSLTKLSLAFQLKNIMSFIILYTKKIVKEQTEVLFSITRNLNLDIIANKGVIFHSFIVFVLLASQVVNAQLASTKCKFLGNIVSGSVRSDFSTYWNQVTPENAGKWGSVESTRNTMSWSGLDIAYNFAKSNGYIFKQHNFVWGQQQPAWIAALPANQQVAEVEQWMQLYGERYPNTDLIDVVNEPLHAVPGYSTALGGSGSTGWDWVIWSFQKARQYCPNAKLLINEYNIIHDNNATNSYLQIIKLLKDRGLIDGIGIQGHYFELGNATVATLTANLTKLGATGLPIYISEYEVELSDDAQQLAKYQEQFTALWTHKDVKGITLWGYTSAMWKPNGFLIKDNGTERSAMTWLKQYVPSTDISALCSSTEVTTIIDENITGMSIYSNPITNGHFTIEFTDELSTITVIDTSGKIVKELNATGLHSPLIVELDVPEGVYLLKILKGKNLVSRKFIAR